MSPFRPPALVPSGGGRSTTGDCNTISWAVARDPGVPRFLRTTRVSAKLRAGSAPVDPPEDHTHRVRGLVRGERLPVLPVRVGDDQKRLRLDLQVSVGE